MTGGRGELYETDGDREEGGSMMYFVVGESLMVVRNSCGAVGI